MKTTAEVAAALRSLSDLEDVLYEREPCGGPLHIITDDGNVRDSDLVFCFRWLHEEPTHTITAVVALEILKLLALMTEPQRLVWWTDQGKVAKGDLTNAGLAQAMLEVRDGKVAVGDSNMDWDRSIWKDGECIWKGRPR